MASITIAGFKNSDADGKFNKNSVDLMWRVLIGLGCVPGVIALFFRLTIPETPRFTMDIERNIDQAVLDIDNFLKTGTFVVDPDAGIERAQAPKASWKDFKQYFSDIENLRVLVGCSYCWFALDVNFPPSHSTLSLRTISFQVAFYGLGLNPPFLAQAMFEDPDSDMYQHLRSTTLTTLTVTVAGLIPGFWICFLFIDRLGRKLIQYTGFAVSTIIFVIMCECISSGLGLHY